VFIKGTGLLAQPQDYDDINSSEVEYSTL